MYRTIAIYETPLQKRIISHFIEVGVISKEGLLLIDTIGHQVKVCEQTIDLNFNKISKVFTSFRNISKLRELNLECENLVSVHFTGINALFFSSFIKCQHKILIDDGIGTPVLLIDNSLYNRLIRFQIRFIFIKVILFLIYNTNLITVQKATQDFSVYYSIYNFKNLFINKQFQFRYIEGVNRKLNILHKTIGFIGSPMVDFGLVSEKRYKSFLLSILTGEGPFVYYLHPDEKKALQFQIEGVRFIRPHKSIEDYFEKNGLPEVLFSFSSSASLNIASANPEAKIYNINYKSFFRNKSHIYQQVFDVYLVNASYYKV